MVCIREAADVGRGARPLTRDQGLCPSLQPAGLGVRGHLSKLLFSHQEKEFPSVPPSEAQKLGLTGGFLSNAEARGKGPALPAAPPVAASDTCVVVVLIVLWFSEASRKKHTSL